MELWSGSLWNSLWHGLFEKEFFFDVIDTQIISGVFQTTNPITVFWGDGDYDTYDGATDQAWSHDYGAAGDYEVTVNGKGNITKFTMEESGANISCALSDLPINIDTINIYGENSMIGDIADIPASCTRIYILGNNTVTGNINSISDNMKLFRIDGSNTIYGNIGRYAYEASKT